MSYEEAIQKIEELDKLQLVEDWRRMLEAAGGRRAIWSILEAGRLYSTTFVAGSSDVTAFNEGRRSLALEVLQHIFTADENVYRMMQLEAVQRADQRKRQIEAAVAQFNEGDD